VPQHLHTGDTGVLTCQPTCDAPASISLYTYPASATMNAAFNYNHGNLPTGSCATGETSEEPGHPPTSPEAPSLARRLTRRATPQSPGDPRTAASSPSYLTPIGPHSRCPIGAQFRRVSQLARHSENTSAASSVREPVHADSSSAWSEGCGISLSTRAWASRSLRCPPRRGRDRSVPMGSLASATNRFCPGQGFQTCTPCGTSRMPWS
jgi:hypothetical protein